MSFRLFNFRTAGNGIRTHDTIFLFVDLANQCLKPLSHTSNLLIGIELNWMCRVGLVAPLHKPTRAPLCFEAGRDYFSVEPLFLLPSYPKITFDLHVLSI
ncbi:hypothetical protein IHE45_15G044000 [Dioscorea alata]|uniref:Uncharacterized protein n=1 Tax=Dioscorea alata TaxID=55571 RepID=A0ACB7UKZ8_DIOAL|nr:hypothetical protein IHE45_15G044000 [Dioscorea alata]